MRIGWVGGLDRSKALFSEVAERAGHTIEIHEGHVGGRGAVILLVRKGSVTSLQRVIAWVENERRSRGDRPSRASG